MKTVSAIALALVLASAGSSAAAPDLWQLAKSRKQIHQFSTLFTAQDVRDRLSTEEGIAAAIDWSKKTALTKVYIEAFRDGYQAERAALERARDRFRAAGFDVSGCVTTTALGKRSNGWKPLSCYTDLPTQDQVQRIFEFTAALFDEIMIDDFWFTDCTCEQCDKARRLMRVDIGGRIYNTAGESWENYRSELMLRLSRDRVINAARAVNPKVKLIIKYPQWYDRFHERGYDVVRETNEFDRIWVGTETRDRDRGGTPQYEAYFLMRWLSGIGGSKTGGGWYDPLTTTERTYVEQARQTVLGGARESMLFCYGALLRNTGPADVEALRAAIPELLAVSQQVQRRRSKGIAAFKPPSSSGAGEAFLFDYAGMLGLPLEPCHEFPEHAQAALFSTHALKDPTFLAKIPFFIAGGAPTLLTDALAQALDAKLVKQPGVRVLPPGPPKALLSMPQQELDSLRAFLLKPLKVTFRAPAEVALYLFRDGSWVVENFNEKDAAVELNGASLNVPGRGWTYKWR